MKMLTFQNQASMKRFLEVAASGTKGTTVKPATAANPWSDWKPTSWDDGGRSNAGWQAADLPKVSSSDRWQTTGSSKDRSYDPGSKALREAERKRAAAERAGVQAETTQASSVNMDFSGRGLDDDTFWYELDGLKASLPRAGSQRFAKVVDVTNNSLTDAGLSNLIQWMKDSDVRCEDLRIHGNQTQDSLALVELVKNERIGIGGGLKGLWASSTGISCECCWRIMEVVSRKRPRPPFRIHLLSGELGDLFRVVKEGVQRGVRVMGIDMERQVIQAISGDTASVDADVVFLEFGVDLHNPWQ